MAIGGFLYSNHDWLSHADTEVDIELALNGIITWMATFANWSIATALTSFGGSGADQAWYWVLSHTSGSRMVWCWTSISSGSPFIHADNNWDGVTKTTNSFFWGAFNVCYVPSTAPALGAGNPSTGSWLPTSSCRFARFGGVGANSFVSVISGGSHRFHGFVRGDEVIFAVTNDSHLSSTIDSAFMASPTMFDRLTHAAHSTTPDSNAVGQINWPLGLTWNDADRAIQGFRVAAMPGGIQVSNLTMESYDAPASNLINDRAPWTWSDGLIYISDADLDNNGIVVGNGLKGFINPEIWRRVNGSIPEKQRLEGGDFVHLADGMCVGYDTANGAVT